jgi:2-oxoglutarate dehydrogenase E1 component
MGAWTFISQQMKNIVPIEVVARQSSGSPAVGLSKLHFMEQEEIIGKIFRQCTCNLQNKYCGLQCEVGKYKTDHKPEHRYFNQTKKQ